MKLMIALFATVVVLGSLGCRTPGVLETGLGPVSVKTSERIRADRKKVQFLQDTNGVARLCDILLHDLRRSRIRSGLHLEVTITSLRVSWGADQMSTSTVVTENGKEIDRFVSLSSTSRNKIMERWARDLSNKIVSRVKKL